VTHALTSKLGHKGYKFSQHHVYHDITCWRGCVGANVLEWNHESDPTICP